MQSLETTNRDEVDARLAHRRHKTEDRDQAGHTDGTEGSASRREQPVWVCERQKRRLSSSVSEKRERMESAVAPTCAISLRLRGNESSLSGRSGSMVL